MLKGENKSIIYNIVKDNGDIVILQGANYRKVLMANKNDLIVAAKDEVLQEINKTKVYVDRFRSAIRNKKYLLGKILHIDADREYLNKCIDLYSKIGIYSYGILSEESSILERLEEINEDIFPDVIVVTGHDSFNNKEINDLNNYANTKYFISSVKYLRKKYPNSIIIAGACQSNFEALIASGADFASSPKRINVHIYDPAIIAIKICTTSVNKALDYDKVSEMIENKKDAFNGVESNGRMRMIY